MKYTAKVNQAQYVGTVKIEPRGGDLTDKQAEAIKADPWGKELIKMGLLEIADGKAPGKPAGNEKDGQGEK